jgi:solute carrier family 25, member 39/40
MRSKDTGGSSSIEGEEEPSGAGIKRGRLFYDKQQRSPLFPNPYALNRIMSSSESKEQQRPVYSPYWVKIISGSVGSAVTACAVTPLEVVKVRFQSMAPPISTLPANVEPCPKCGVYVFSCGISERLVEIPYEQHASKSLSSAGSGSRIEPPSTGTFSMLRHIFKTEGLAGIYAGLGATLVMGVPNTVLYFVSYDELIARFRTDSNATWIPAVAGSAARLVASFSTAPLELIRTRQAGRTMNGRSSPAKYNGLLHEMKYLIHTDGFLSLYRGLSPTLFRDAPFSAVYWFSIERLRDMWRNNVQRKDEIVTPSQQFGQAFFNGSVAGMIAAACTTPLDVIKTRQQVGSPVPVPAPAQSVVETACEHEGMTAYQHRHPKTNPNSTMSLFRHILQTEGVPGLWRGNQTRMIKVAPACAVMLSSYEIGKRVLGDETV